MIPAVHPRGSNVGGLLRYLFGPGKREEHVAPRVVAAWDGADPLPALQPPRLPGGGYDVRRLTRLLEQPVRIGFRPPAKTVWHCSIRTHPTDRTLSDGHWAHIAAEVMAAVGLAPHGDLDAVRWLAVRHNDDHIHLVATLVRQNRRTVWPWQDKRKAQAACRDLEERYGLHCVAMAGTSARRWPGAVELNKAARLAEGSKRAAGARRVVAPREQLRRQVRETAAIATDEHDFFARLAGAGLQVRLRRGSRDPDEVTGYAVALPGHRTANGDAVWYGGGRLAADLTLPQLRSRWTGTPPPHGGNAARIAAAASVPLHTARRAAETVRDATAAMAASPGPAAASAIAYGIADLLTATAQAWEGQSGGPLTDAAEWLDRVAHQLRDRIPARSVSQAGHLRAMARLIAAVGRMSRDEDTAAALRLVYTLAAFVENLADLCQAANRLQQAQAAREAVSRLRAYAHSSEPAGAEEPGVRIDWYRRTEPASTRRHGLHR